MLRRPPQTHSTQGLESLLVAHAVLAGLDHKLDPGVNRLLRLLLQVTNRISTAENKRWTETCMQDVWEKLPKTVLSV